VHSFWVPQLAGKVDLVPNKTNRLWIDAEAPGTYTGQCAEYCGTQHAKMLLRVVAQPLAEFEDWVEAQKRPANSTGEFDAGRRVFLETACLNCHTIRGTVANGRFGPDLTHFMDRQTLGAGAGDNTAENLEAWIVDPSHLKPGVLMPAMQLADGERTALVAYLRSLY
jgi:cytochrome c oxidase subunit 2